MTAKKKKGKGGAEIKTTAFREKRGRAHTPGNGRKN